jgi:hypothetical protein
LELAAVLLIGETPKLGIHKQAFRNALVSVDRLLDAANRPPEIRILRAAPG